MLREVFRTEKVKYKKPGDTLPGGFGVYGMVSSSTFENPNIFMHGIIKIGPGPNDYDFHGWRYHGVTGKLIQEWEFLGKDNKVAPPSFQSITYVTTARSGKYWGSGWSNAWIRRMHYGNIATIAMGEDKLKDEDMEKFWIFDGEPITHTHFEQKVSYGTTNATYFMPDTSFAIDDTAKDGGRFISPSGGRIGHGTLYGLSVFNWTTGKWIYDIPMPAAIANISLEDEGRCYCLMNNRTIILVDYLRGEILGAAKIPPLTTGKAYGGDSGLDVIFDQVRMSWDRVYRRMLVIEQTPDNADGTSSMCVRGFRMVPEPVRVTTPIPLRVPRPGRTIPVYVQVVDDLNQGIGSYAVDVTVTGDGKLVGQPITDHLGHAIISVECDPVPQVVY
jgi:hypothetical protein